MKNIYSDLNPEQRKAVENVNGPMMVIAGAGSGKTRVLTYRIAHLLNTGIDPFRILALTFTNKAAREMKKRILSIVGESEAMNVWMGTFHSIFARILRIESELLAFTSNFTIYDTNDSKNLIKKIIKEQELDIKIYTPSYVLNRISSAKINLISAQEYSKNSELTNADKMSGKPKVAQLYVLYQNRCKKANAMDFDDLLINTNILLRDFPEILLKYQKRFKYILIDEYQDTNYVQYMIIKKLAAREENICVVGDDAQSIYAFRGANIQNILNFKSDYPDLKIFKMEQNYRSTKNIVNAANSIISNNKDQITKKIWTENDQGGKIKLLKSSTDNEEGRLVANSIFENKMNHQLHENNFVILYRTNAQSRAFEESLRKLNIPYKIYGGLSFYSRKEIKDLLAYFRLVINHNDEEALSRVINYPARGIGNTTLEKITVAASQANISQWEILENISNYQLNISPVTRNKISNFITMLKSFAVSLKKKNAYELAKQIAMSSGIIKELYEDDSPEGLSRYDNVEELLNAIKDFSENENNEVVLVEGEKAENSIRTLDEFIQDIALLTDADKNLDKNTNHVSLMTIHAAKGLEFPFVYIVGMEENLFPSIQSVGTRTELEEERRLFYVALTRAKKQAIISYAETRYRWGNLSITEPSRFIQEIDPKYIEQPKIVSKQNKEVFYNNNYTKKTQKSQKFSQATFSKFQNKNLKKISNLNTPKNDDIFETSPSEELQSGMEVEHKRFGVGKIINIEGTGPNTKATVFFQNVGQKKLLLKFAKLKIIKR